MTAWRELDPYVDADETSEICNLPLSEVYRLSRDLVNKLPVIENGYAKCRWSLKEFRTVQSQECQ